MTENKHFPKKIENLELALHKTRNLLSITDKILASKTLAVSDDPTFRTPIIENLNISKHTFGQAT
jgi:hypothetical protein